MPLFAYKAKDANGAALVGIVEAPSEKVAIEVLQEKNFIVLSLEERKRESILQVSIPFLNGVKTRDVVIFSRELAVMISATVPLVQALRILIRQTTNATFKVIISEIADEVDGGAKLSSALARYPQVFSDFFVNMIRSGETTGKLEETLTFLADQQEKDYDLHQKITSALVYPAFILSGIIVVGAIMMIFVIPKLTAIIVESGVALPFTTRLLIAVSDFFVTKWWLLTALVILAVIAYRLVSKTAVGQYHIDRAKLQLPVFGSMFRKIYITRLARGLSTLLQSGVPLTRSLEIVADIISNSVYGNLTRSAIKEVEEGNPLSTSFSQSPLVPPMLGQMMNVGEQTGRLDMILAKLADFYTREVENAVASLVTLIEPFVLIMLGGAVGMLVSAILLPIYNISTSV